MDLCRYKILLVTVFVFVVAFGCGSKEIKEKQSSASIKNPTVNKTSRLNEAQRRVHLENDAPACKVLFNDKPLSLGEVEKCLFNISETSVPYVVAQLIKHKPPVSQQVLDKSVVTFTHGSVFTKYTDSIKKLIVAGASTENVSLPYVWHHGDFACDTVMLVLNNNLPLYKDEHTLKAKPKENRNVSNLDTKPRLQDLYWLANTADGRGMCPEAIKLLARYNPNLLNTQGFTPLHSYLGDLNHPQWDIRIAKFLMTRKNVNMHGKRGVTPLHILLTNKRKTKWDLIVLKEMLKLGGDVSIKGEVGEIIPGTTKRKRVSVKELILKRSDLVSVLRK